MKPLDSWLDQKLQENRDCYYNGLNSFKSKCPHLKVLFVPKYNPWDKVDPVELFECSISKTESNENQRVPIMLPAEGRGVEFLILWLDCDKEGENICFEIVDTLTENMGLVPGQTLFRAGFSALTEPDLKEVMATLTFPNENESKSVDARQELDLRIGCCFTRFQTRTFHAKYGSLDSCLISYGPCQTLTLGFCVKRHDKIQQFKPEKFWGINITVGLDERKEVSLEWRKKRLFDKKAVEFFLSTLKECKTAVVSSIKKKECVKKRPWGLNTVEMLRLASSKLGMSPHHTMQIAERHYTQGYVSYPRTETTHYPANFDFCGLVHQIARHDKWSGYVSSTGIVNPVKGHDAGYHHPITLLLATHSGTFHDNDSAKLYNFIVRYFLSTETEDCTYLETSIDFRISAETFSFQGKEIINVGFTKVYPFTVISSDDQIPQVIQGKNYPILEKKLYESETKPPDYLNESELISLMEKHGIGTDASISVHINNICQRNYVTVAAGRKLIPTDLGIILVHGYLKIDSELVLPLMRSEEIEKQLDLITHGQATLGPVMDYALDIFKAKFLYFVKNINEMDDLFEVSYSKMAEGGKPFSRCGKCRRSMKLVSSISSRLHCTTCNETYSVPQGGVLRGWNDFRCPLDDFELISYSAGSKGKSYTFCPYCINYPPFPGMRKGNGCNSCRHPTRPYGLSMKGICACGECDTGLLVLDPASVPKWKIVCNKCDVFINVFVGSRKVTLLEDSSCESCESSLAGVELPKKSGLEGELKGCIFCTEEFEPYVEKHRAQNIRPSDRGWGRGRGRRRGSGGRRRGRR